MKIIIPLVAILILISVATPAFAKRPAPTPSPEPITRSVCIDPGHGGSEIGSVNLEYLEKNINLEVALLLKDRLLAAGYIENVNLFMTRQSDVTLTNADRYNYCNSKNAAILLSIHHNGSTDPNVDYSKSLYSKQSDVALAQEVVNTLSSPEHLNLPNMGISRFTSGVLLKSNMPATISEGFFLTSATEYNLIKNENRLAQEANGLLAAINNYFN